MNNSLFYGNVEDMTLAEQVVETLKQIGVPTLMISGEAPLRKLTTLYHLAQAEAAKEIKSCTDCYGLAQPGNDRCSYHQLHPVKG
jgi:hypothetical protein